MRVDIGIVLSVLSFSVLAKVIPNDGYNGPLLVRRAVGPDPMGLLWKRADGDDEQEPSPMDSVTEAEADVETSNNAETGASASSDGSSPDHPSGSVGLSKLDQLPDSTERPHWSFQEQLLTQRPKYILQSDEESIQKAIEKVTEAFEGESRNEFILETEAVLTNVLSSVRMFLASYDSKIMAPFYFIIPGGTTDQQSLTKEMLDIQKSGKTTVEEFLDILKIAIYRITQTPRKVMRELRNIVYRVAYMLSFTTFLCDSHYMVLFPKVKTTENEAYVEVTKAYVFQMKSDWELASELLKKIKGMVNDGMVKPKTMLSRYLSLMSNVKNRLEIKDGPPADTTTD
ncbi:hypothetical protein BASA83_007734 [Batrachochytrium salamandrivorans]|nr:hypothetical protein BASA81_014116 [Batrachochytrium salamandrivorans]KAH9270211.1 hypothetical protein BASA83_007734 [Batrachochytrium salamandrivorans]